MIALDKTYRIHGALWSSFCGSEMNPERTFAAASQQKSTSCRARDHLNGFGITLTVMVGIRDGSFELTCRNYAVRPETASLS